MLSNAIKALIIKAIKPMTTENLQTESAILTEEKIESEEVIALINEEIASRPTT